MKMRTKTGMISVGSVLVLALAVASFRPSSKTRSRSAVNVSLQDVSGRPLSSLFDGMPVDKGYPAFKRLVADRRPSRCGGRPNQARRLLRELGLWFESVVHAMPPPNCSCGYIPSGEQYDPCSTDCGFELVYPDITRSTGREGIKGGAPLCKELPPPTCPGYIPTIRCECTP